MNFFKKLVLSAKVERGTLTVKDFETLYQAVLAGERGTREILQKYFRTTTPPLVILNRIHYGDASIRAMYYEGMAGRHLSDDEQLLLVRIASPEEKFAFPHPLDQAALYDMFVTRKHDIKRMARYVGTYALPEEYEIKLVELAKSMSCSFELNAYANILDQYIMECKDVIFDSEKSQEALINYNEPTIREHLASFCDLEEVFPSEELVENMIADSNVRALRMVLYKSRVISPEQRALIAEKLPFLKNAVEISEIRYRLYQEEKEKGIFSGVATPSTNEKSLMAMRGDLGEDFIDLVCQKMNEPSVTVYFLVWAAEHYQELEVKALRKLQYTSVN